MVFSEPARLWYFVAGVVVAPAELAKYNALLLCCQHDAANMMPAANYLL
jgi:hypothetical protein